MRELRKQSSSKAAMVLYSNDSQPCQAIQTRIQCDVQSNSVCVYVCVKPAVCVQLSSNL